MSEQVFFNDNLKSTELTDSDNNYINNMAKEITKDCQDHRDAAMKIFDFVRDHVLFGGSNLYAKASKTLMGGIGDCGIKSNVQLALLRAVGIPSRLRVVLIKTESLKGLLPHAIYKRLPETISHLWCQCYISDRWLSCETTYDQALFQGLKKGEYDGTSSSISSIEWDGKTDLTLFDLWKVKDIGVFNCYDDFVECGKDSKSDIRMPPKLYWMLFGGMSNKAMNKYLDNIRKCS